MRKLILATTITIALSASAHAQVHTVNSAAGPITVSNSFAQKIVPLIAELKSIGFNGIVKCFSSHRGRHVAHSLHFSGNACDFLPHGKGVRGHNRMPTVAMMFSHRVAELIRKYGLRNGCSFRDCGHIDMGHPTREYTARSHRRSYDSNHYVSLPIMDLTSPARF